MFEDSGDDASSKEVEDRPVAVGAEDDIIGSFYLGLLQDFVYSCAEDGLAGNYEPARTQRTCEFFQPGFCELSLLFKVNSCRRNRDRIHGGPHRHILGNWLDDVQKNQLAASLLSKLLRLSKNFCGNVTSIDWNEKRTHGARLHHPYLACEKNQR